MNFEVSDFVDGFDDAWNGWSYHVNWPQEMGGGESCSFWSWGDAAELFKSVVEDSGHTWSDD